MIYNLKGRLTVCDANFIVVECGGIGFKCFTSLNTAKQLAEIGKEVNVYTHLAVREDAMDLYAFATVAELDAFKLLITVSGIGPKAGISILSELTPDRLALCIASGDAKSITKAQGIGKKTAERVVLELKDKIGAVATDAVSSAVSNVQNIDKSSAGEAIEALVSLGYSHMQETEMDFESRIVTSDFTPEDNDIENSLRPKILDDYIGQDKVKENLAVYIQAARGRGEALDHVLLYGPPGLGKTTLAGVIANEMGVNLRVTSGPAIEKQGDLAALLTNLQEGDVLFIDEIHRLNRQVEEVLYPAMEDGALDIIIGKGPSARSIRLDLPHFTLIGATTRAGQLSAPLRDRFGVIFRLEMYTNEQLASIVKRSADILNIPVDEKGAMEIASRSRGTPRIANRLLKRSRDFAQVKYDGIISREAAIDALERMEIDNLGLDNIDRILLTTMIKNYNGGPVGLDTIAAAIGEESVTIEDVYEPYLMQIGFLSRTPRGRCATALAYKHLGLKQPGQQTLI